MRLGTAKEAKRLAISCFQIAVKEDTASSRKGASVIDGNVGARGPTHNFRWRGVFADVSDTKRTDPHSISYSSHWAALQVSGV